MNNSKKYIYLLITGLILAAIVNAQEKRYTVSLTLGEWQAVINQIDSKRVSSMLENQLIPQLDTTKTEKK